MEIRDDCTISNPGTDIHFISSKHREDFPKRVGILAQRESSDIISTDSFLEPHRQDGVLCITGNTVSFSPTTFIPFSDAMLHELESVKQAGIVIHMSAGDKGIIQSFLFSEQTSGALIFGRDEFLHPEISKMTEDLLKRYMRVKGKIGDKLTDIFMNIMRNNGTTFPDESDFDPQKFKDDISRVVMF